jgi:hypothetical protein
VSIAIIYAKLIVVNPLHQQNNDAGSPQEVGVKIRKPLTNSLICLVVLLIVGIAAFADTIKLKDGSVLKGKVVSFSQGRFTIVVYIGGASSRHVIPVEEIESVEFDASDVMASGRSSSSSGGGLTPVSPTTSARSEPIETTPPIDSGAGSRAPKDPANPPAGNDLPPPEADPGPGLTIAEKTVNVAAAADWTSTEIRIQRGQRVIISATGEVDLGDGKRSTSDGVSATDNRKLIPNRPTGSLIAVVGDDNDDFVHIGSAGEFVATHAGILFLSVNEGNLKDNSGSFTARVKVTGK